MSFRVLVVCTGNICRSPIAAALLAARTRGADIAVDSAGTHAYPGHPIDPDAATALAELGQQAMAHRSVRLTPGLIDASDLVLTAATEHRRIVLSACPRAMRRAFTLREFARLGAELDPGTGDDLPARVAEVAARRGRQAELRPGQDDVDDPYRAPYPIMQRCAREIDAAVREIVTVLGVISSG